MTTSLTLRTLFCAEGFNHTVENKAQIKLNENSMALMGFILISYCESRPPHPSSVFSIAYLFYSENTGTQGI